MWKYGGDWTTFVLDVSRFRGLLTRYLQYHRRQIHDLEELLNSNGGFLGVDKPGMSESFKDYEYGE